MLSTGPGLCQEPRLSLMSCCRLMSAKWAKPFCRCLNTHCSLRGEKKKALKCAREFSQGCLCLRALSPSTLHPLGHRVALGRAEDGVGSQLPSLHTARLSTSWQCPLQRGSFSKQACSTASPNASVRPFGSVWSNLLTHTP